MQKRSTNEGVPPPGQIYYQEMPLPADFPVHIFSYTQGSGDWSRLHFHNGVEIGLCLEGEGLFFIENRILPFSAGDVSLIFSSQPHIARSGPGAPSRWYFITVDFRQMFCGGELVRQPGLAPLLSGGTAGSRPLPGILSGSRFPPLASLLRQIIRELNQREGRYQERVKALFWVFLLHLLDMKEDVALSPDERAVRKDGGLSGGFSGGFSAISPALTRITNRYYEPFGVRELAADCSLSETQFRRLFRQAMGCPPLQYLHQVRLRMARALLSSTRMPVSQIAGEVGFVTLSSFNRQFQDSFGLSPSQWRREQLQQRQNAAGSSPPAL